MKYRAYILEWVFLSFSLGFMLLSWLADYYLSEINFFARSGSVAVLLAAIVEYRISPHIYDDIQRQQYLQKKIDLPVPIKAKPPKNRSSVALLAHVLLVAGTLVWGYGDLLQRA